MSKKITFTITVYVEPDGSGFHAFCPALPGLHVDGATEKEACRNAAAAAVGYIKSMQKHGESIPIGMMRVEEEQPTQTPATPVHCVEQIPVAVAFG